jgi:hypothetical protein
MNTSTTNSMNTSITPSVCFPRLPFNTEEKDLMRFFCDVERIDFVTMQDTQGDFKMAFIHFNHPELFRGFVDYIGTHAHYINGWLVRPNYKPVKRSTRKWTPEELVEIEQYFKEKEAQMTK